MVTQEVKILGKDGLKYFEDPKAPGKEDSKQNGSSSQVKASFKIEINDEERKVRDAQQTTVYHTGSQIKPLIELDEEDRLEIERKQMEEIEEGEHDDDEDDGEDFEDDPDEDLNF